VALRDRLADVSIQVTAADGTTSLWSVTGEELMAAVPETPEG
jgi:hypothetical protein